MPTVQDIIYDEGKETVTIHKLKGIRLSSLADTNSMDGFMDIGHTPLLTTDFVHTDLGVGDIMTLLTDFLPMVMKIGKGYLRSIAVSGL